METAIWLCWYISMEMASSLYSSAKQEPHSKIVACSACVLGGEPGCVNCQLSIGTRRYSCRDTRSIATRPQMLACRAPNTCCMLAALHCTSTPGTLLHRTLKNGPTREPPSHAVKHRLQGCIGGPQELGTAAPGAAHRMPAAFSWSHSWSTRAFWEAKMSTSPWSMSACRRLISQTFLASSLSTTSTTCKGAPASGASDKGECCTSNSCLQLVGAAVSGCAHCAGLAVAWVSLPGLTHQPASMWVRDTD